MVIISAGFLVGWFEVFFLIVTISWKAGPLRIVISEPVSTIPLIGTPSIYTSIHLRAVSSLCITDVEVGKGAADENKNSTTSEKSFIWLHLVSALTIRVLP